MKTNNTKLQNAKAQAKALNENIKGAKGEIKNVFTNAFVVINILNRLASGKAQANTILAESGISCENVKAVAKALYKMQPQGTRYAFNVDILPHNAKDVWCIIESTRKVPAHKYELHSMNVGANSVTFKYYKPICEGVTMQAIFNAFADYAKAQAKQAVKDAKQAQDKAKKESDFAKAKQAVTAVFGELADTFTQDEIIEKYALIKGTK